MRAVATVIALVSLTAAAAQDLPKVVLDRSLPGYQVRQRYLGAGASTMAALDTVSLSVATAEAVINDADRAVYPQEGTGGRHISLGADSYLHLDHRQMVWGGAEFCTGTLRDIRWTDCTDYPLVAPYVLGDDTGGDMSFRRYNFGGGYARRLADRWTLGTAMVYRAEMAWRDVDPRVKTVVSDLGVNVGVGYHLSDTHLVGVDASLRSYTQNCDLDFYNPVNEINTLPLTGLGTYYKRFAGNTNKNSGHSGFGYGLSARWASTDAVGLQVSASVGNMHMEQLLRNFNNITLASTLTTVTDISAAYGLRVGSVLLYPEVQASYFRRLGTENLFGTASGSSYDKIGSRSPYLHEIWEATVDVPAQVVIGGGYLTIHPGASYRRSDESLTSAGRSLMVENISESIGLGYRLVSGKWLWRADAAYSHSAPSAKRCVMPITEEYSPLPASVMDTYTMLSASTDRYNIEISACRSFGRMMASLTAGYARTRYGTLADRDDVHVSLEVYF